jgi:hypothetical protein
MPSEPFRVIEDDEPEGTAPPQSSPTLDTIGISALMLGLSALSKRLVVALSNLFVLLTVASAFWLFYSIRAEPTVPQLVLAGIYSAFVLAANFIVRK